MNRFNLSDTNHCTACDTNCVIDIKWDSVESGKRKVEIINYLAVAATANDRCTVTCDHDRRHGFRVSVMNHKIKLPVTYHICFYGAVVPS
jgi:hypothetical protein